MQLSIKRLRSAMHLGGLTLRQALSQTWTRMNTHEILTRAAAITFYATAAMVPFLALVITLTAHLLPWIARNATAGGDPLQLLRELLPADAASLVSDEMSRLRQKPPTGFISFGLVAILWLSSSLFMAIIDAMNRIVGVNETRPYWRLRLVAILMSLSQAAILIVAFATVVAWPQILGWLGLSQAGAALATVIHVMTVFMVILMSFAIALYFSPDADQRWEWITPGSLLGTIALFCVSLLFRVYVQDWGNYSATYGSLTGVVVLTSWFWLLALGLLTAAEFNKVIEDASPLGKQHGQKYEPTSDGAVAGNHHHSLSATRGELGNP
jgi:membrane protein